jgi:hypothetical protein
MKKFLGVIAIAATMVACNNSADTTENAKDSLDSVANAKKDMVDSTADQRKDAVDSITEAKKDALDKMDTLNKKDTTHK